MIEAGLAPGIFFEGCLNLELLDDNARGGDIDLLVLSPKIDLLRKLYVLAELHRLLGDQKIDLAVFADSSAPFACMAIESGIRL